MSEVIFSEVRGRSLHDLCDCAVLLSCERVPCWFDQLLSEVTELCTRGLRSVASDAQPDHSTPKADRNDLRLSCCILWTTLITTTINKDANKHTDNYNEKIYNKKLIALKIIIAVAMVAVMVYGMWRR